MRYDSRLQWSESVDAAIITLSQYQFVVLNKFLHFIFVSTKSVIVSSAFLHKEITEVSIPSYCQRRVVKVYFCIERICLFLRMELNSIDRIMVTFHTCDVMSTSFIPTNGCRSEEWLDSFIVLKEIRGEAKVMTIKQDCVVFKHISHVFQRSKHSCQFWRIDVADVQIY